jgi:hypothetical protein
MTESFSNNPMDLSEMWCECEKPIIYKDYSTITARGMTACRKCGKFVSTNKESLI